MTSLPSARRRAEEFARAVDTALARGSAPASASGGSSLVDLVLALDAVPAPAPRPDFTADLRQRLLLEAATLLTAAGPAPAVAPAPGRGPSQVRRPRRQGRVVAAATAFAVVGGTAGVATAAQHALPGEVLYPIKRALEGAEFRFSTSDAGRGRDLLEQASSRLDELRALLPVTAGSGGPSGSVAARLPGTVRAFTSQASEGSGLLLEAFEEDRDPRTVTEVRAFAADSVGSLSELAAIAPSDVREELVDAASALQSIDREAVELCATCGEGAPPLEIPSDFGRPTGDDVVGSGSGEDGEPGDDADTTTAGDDDSRPDGTADDTSDQDGGDEDGSGSEGRPGPSGGPTDVEATPPDPTGDGGEATDGDDGTGTPDDGVTDSPTDAPTDSPTDNPTDGPTEGPTDGPTDGPTEEPDDGPTDGPDEDPDEPDDDGMGAGDPGGDEDDPRDDGDDDDPRDDGDGGHDDEPDDDESSDDPGEDVVTAAVPGG